MSMDKQPVNINFSQGVDTKTDPWQLPIGKFSRLKNSVFDRGGQMRKRFGYSQLTSLPNSTYAYLTTFRDNLTAIGPNIAALNETSQSWVTKGSITPMELSVVPLVRNSVNQSQCDAVVSSTGLVCTVFTQGSATLSYRYMISDVATGQNIIDSTVIPPGSGVVTGSPRVFVLGHYFVIVYTNVISSTNHLQYVAIPFANPTSVTTPADIASAYISATTLSWDGVVFSNQLFVAYNTTTGAQKINITYLTASAAAQGGAPVTATTFTGEICTMMSLCVDSTANQPLVYLAYYDSAGSTGYVAAVNTGLSKVLNPTQIISSGTYLNITSAAQSGSVTVFIEQSNNYSYDSTVPSHLVKKVSVTSAGSVGSLTTSIASVGLGSKAFILDSVIYYLSAHQSPYQSTYFLINGTSSTRTAPIVVAKLAYENGGGYLTTGLPGVTVSGTTASIPYLFKDFISSLTVQNNTQETTTGGVYSQTGVNLSSFNFTDDGISTSEIGQNLHLSGGFLGM